MDNVHSQSLQIKRALHKNICVVTFGKSTSGDTGERAVEFAREVEQRSLRQGECNVGTEFNFTR